jgi:CubicO group peptidase (beta-lactamase class C family)
LAGTILALGTTLSASDTEIKKQLKADADRVAKAAMKSRQIPGMMVVIVMDGKLISSKSYGDDPRFAKPPDEHTMYDLGKVSEALTAFAAMRLVDQGKIGLKDPIGKYVKGLPDSWQAVTVEDLLTQRSGIPELPLGHGTLEEAVAQAGKGPLAFTPGTKQYYRSSNAEILGQVVASASGEKYLNAMTTSLFKPLKMDDTGDLQKLVRWHFRMASAADVNSQVNLNRSSADVRPTIASKLGTSEPELMAQVKKMVPDYVVPSEGLASTPQDMAKFSSAVLSGGMTKADTSQFFSTNAPGWDVCMAGTETVFRATGLVHNNSGVVVNVLPDRKTALILMWNPGSDSTNDMLLTPSQEILSTAYGLPKDGWLCTR